MTSSDRPKAEDGNVQLRLGAWLGDDAAGPRRDTCVRRPCRVYNLWPEDTVLKSRDLNVPYLDKDIGHISLYIQTFANRPDFSVPAQSLPDNLGFSHVRLSKDVGFWFGNVVVGDTEDGSTVRIGSPISNPTPIARYQGEVDIGIMLPAGKALTQFTVTIAEHMLEIAIPFLATSLGEHFIPITTTQIDEWHGSDRSVRSPHTFRLEAKTRITVSITQQLREAFDSFCALVANFPIEELRGIAAASRRMNSALLEEDIIDKYCDFWECCEFLAPPRKTVGGMKLPAAKDAAITALLCSFIQPSKRRRDVIREKIHACYVIRNDLVHNAIENPEMVEQNMKIIAEIALQLFRCRVGLPFESTPELTSVL
jgi:hypothetical protein